MAITSFKTYLMKKGSSGNTYTKLVDIKEFPDLGKAPDTIDVTTLSDPSQVLLPDIEKPGQMEFVSNYTATDYSTLKALEGIEQDLAVWFGATESSGTYTPDGSAGKFEFKGYIKVYVKGAGVSSAVDMGVVVTPTSAIVKAS